MDITQPIFIVGSGRSGTTWLARMIATHPELAYFSSWTNRYPQQPWLAILSRLNEIDALEARTRYTRKWPRITEAYTIWDGVLPGFSRPAEDLHAGDATDAQKEATRQIVRAHLRWQRKDRFVAKYVGWLRIDLIRSIFPDAHFICLDRDPRPMLYSQMALRWGFEERPDVWDQMTVEERLRYYVERHMLYLDYKQQYTAGVDYYQFYYEDLLAQPVATVRAMCERVNLATPQRFLDKVASWHVRAETNDHWRAQLSHEQISLFNRLLDAPLRNRGLI